MTSGSGFEQYPFSAGSTWWLNDPENAACAKAAALRIDEPERIQPDQLLKQSVRRLVFLLPSPVDDDSGVVVKAFPLEGLKTRLKHRKYAPSEAANLREAARRGLSVPDLIGWGEKRRTGLVVWNAVLMEHIRGHNFAETMTRAADDTARRAWLDRTVTLLVPVFRAACNHIDLKPEALIFGNDPGDDRIIDFQYCTFGSEPDLQTWMAQAGHFVHWWDRDSAPGDDLVEYWLSELSAALEIPMEHRDEARRIFEDHRTRVRSIAERLHQ